jgi:hypothetical protein
MIARRDWPKRKDSGQEIRCDGYLESMYLYSLSLPPSPLPFSKLKAGKGAAVRRAELS